MSIKNCISIILSLANYSEIATRSSAKRSTRGSGEETRTKIGRGKGGVQARKQVPRLATVATVGIAIMEELKAVLISSRCVTSQ